MYFEIIFRIKIPYIPWPFPPVWEIDISFFFNRVTGSNTLELCQLLNSMWPRSLASSSLSTSSMSSNVSVASTSSASSSVASPEEPVSPPLPPLVIIIDDLHAAGKLFLILEISYCKPFSILLNFNAKGQHSM